MLINMMEHYVDERLSELLSKNDCCKCEVCVEDMKAYALNRLPSRYVSTVNGEIFTRITQEMESQPTVDLDVAVMQAITSVGANPRHKK
ncbi:MAG: competence protein ComFB [Ruminococcaceae bacterium]|nr:competence protein ComFB [Oscillospiraceae bacterium]MBQ8931614.1 late competence development ComFB family protein [Ruminiclostridium sp.]